MRRIPVFQPPAGVRSSLGGRRRGHTGTVRPAWGRGRVQRPRTRAGLQERPPFGRETHGGGTPGLQKLPFRAENLAGHRKGCRRPAQSSCRWRRNSPRGLPPTGPPGLAPQEERSSWRQEGSPLLCPADVLLQSSSEEAPSQLAGQGEASAGLAPPS